VRGGQIWELFVAGDDCGGSGRGDCGGGKRQKNAADRLRVGKEQKTGDKKS